MYNLQHVTKSTNSTPLLIHYDALYQNNLDNIKRVLSEYDNTYDELVKITNNAIVPLEKPMHLLQYQSALTLELAQYIEKNYQLMHMVCDYDFMRFTEYAYIFGINNDTFFNKIKLLASCIDVMREYTKNNDYNLTIINQQYYATCYFISHYNKIKSFYDELKESTRNTGNTSTQSTDSTQRT